MDAPPGRRRLSRLLLAVYWHVATGNPRRWKPRVAKPIKSHRKSIKLLSLDAAVG